MPGYLYFRLDLSAQIACAMLVWNFLKRFASKIGKSIYQVKHGLLSKYLTDQLKYPSIKMKVI